MDSINSSRGSMPASRSFRLPAVQVADFRLDELRYRNVYSRIGCLLVVTALAVPLFGRLLPLTRPLPVLLVGVLALSFGVFGARRGGGCASILIAAIGLELTLTASLRSAEAVGAAWIVWTVTSLIAAVGAVWAFTLIGPSKTILQATRAVFRQGCRIAFFRPFSETYSSRARNLLLPLLKNYGSVFFIADATYRAAAVNPQGYFSQDYSALPGLLGGNAYSDNEWKDAVLRQLETVDIVVIDISVLSPSVLWEINECYERFPSHRILFVLAGEVFGEVPLEQLIQRSYEHAIKVVRALLEMNAHLQPDDPRRKIQPLLLVYTDTAEGLIWLSHALHQAMLNVVSIETTGQPTVVPASA